MIPFPMVVFLVFLTLKLVGYLTWSWWWVTSPLWIGAAVWLSLLVIFATRGFIAEAVKQWCKLARGGKKG